MLTTTFSKPQTMEINLPVKPKGEVTEEEQNALKASKAFNIIIAEDNKLYYYLGMANDPIEGPIVTNFSADGIRKILLEKNSAINEMVVLIKPTNDAIYKNVVDILDEMNISDIKRYALVEVAKEELELIKNIK
jgi:biopolymer transport protein ExbD